MGAGDLCRYGYENQKITLLPRFRRSN